MISENEKINVLILDDQLVQREGIARVVEKSDKMTVIGVASNTKEALKILMSNKVEIALVDLVLKDEQGISVGKMMRNMKPDLKVIIYTREKSMIVAAKIIRESKETLEPRLHGYILTRKIDSPEYLHDVYAYILQTGYYIDSDVFRWHYQLKEIEPLTPREEECAILVARGMSNSEIADRMYISLRRVENLNNSLYLKFRIIGNPGDPGRRVLLAETIKLLYGHQLPATHIKLLLIEDQEVVRTRIIRQLSLVVDHISIAEAENGIEGINLANKIKPDIILSDIHLPDIDGFQVARQIVSKFSKSKIILISSEVSPTYQKEALQAGALGLLPKKQVNINAIMRLCYPR
jgi:DNA-binding NarL/FixJ family response regulator